MKQEYQVTCPFCAVGCRFKILKGLNDVVHSDRTVDEIDFAYDSPVNEGALCPRGHFAFELLSHPRRLGKSFYRANGVLSAETPERIFQHIAEEWQKGDGTTFGLLADPMLSLHDIRALLDFARNIKLKAVDFIMPADRHLFRAQLDHPFEYRKCDDSRQLADLNYILGIGNIFTKQPVLSRFILKSKYAFRKNAFFNINPFAGRTSLFADMHVEHAPHLEPLLLFHLFSTIYSEKEIKTDNDDLRFLADFSESNVKDLFDKYLSSSQRSSLDRIADSFLSSQKTAIINSTHLYNASGQYLTGILSAALSVVSESFYVPLYTDGNLSALEELSADIYPELAIGRQPLLHQALQGDYDCIFAAGWNPEYLLFGNDKWPHRTEWIISSLVNLTVPENTRALLPQTHPYEQMDLRTNFLPWQSQGSPQVKTPVGSAQTLSHFSYLLYQKLLEHGIRMENPITENASKSWRDNLPEEWRFYRAKLAELTGRDGAWLIPHEHMAHFREGALTRYSDWAKKECDDAGLRIPPQQAREAGLTGGQYFLLDHNGEHTAFKAVPEETGSGGALLPYAHYLPARKLMISEFAPHNKEQYLWCRQADLTALRVK